MVWGALFFIAGMRMIWGWLDLPGACRRRIVRRISAGFHTSAGRIKRFMNPALGGDNFSGRQAAMERHSGTAAGFRDLRPPGEGIAKAQALPGQPHRLRVLRVAAEEFGIIPVPGRWSRPVRPFVVIRNACLRRLCQPRDMFSRCFAASGPCDPVRPWQARDQHGGQSAIDPRQGQ